MEVILKQISKRENAQEMNFSHDYMPRVHEVKMPCRWMNLCYDGKCPYLVRLNGNLYCANKKAIT